MTTQVGGKTLFKMLAAAMLGLAILAGATNMAIGADGPPTSTGGDKPEATCKGRFPNPVTDVCWRCIFPIRMFSVKFNFFPNQEDASSGGGSPLCACKNNFGIPIPGVPVTFWEPARIFEATRKPFCFPTLAGLSIDLPFNAPGHSQPTPNQRLSGQNTLATYNEHWIINNLLYLLQVLKDDGCLDKQGFDVAYMGELDPLSQDDFSAFILNPDGVLYSNPVAQAACAIDCIQATTGFGKPELYWCGGCQGSIFPLTRNLSGFYGGVQASTLLMQRTTMRLHREGLMYDAASDKAQCEYQIQPIMNKQNYKFNMIYPQRQGLDEESRCCQPYGRNTARLEAFKEVPYVGEDFAYQVFRKRNCCSTNLLKAAAEGATGTSRQPGREQ